MWISADQSRISNSKKLILIILILRNLIDSFEPEMNIQTVPSFALICSYPWVLAKNIILINIKLVTTKIKINK